MARVILMWTIPVGPLTGRKTPTPAFNPHILTNPTYV